MIQLHELIEVTLDDPEDFKIIMETLSRIGVASKRDNVLYQSCHILHKQSRYYIVHFKEMFLMDGKTSDFSGEDRARRNTIANLLAEWGLCRLVDPNKSKSPIAPVNQIKILHAAEKKDWQLVPKYTIGKRYKKKEE